MVAPGVNAAAIGQVRPLRWSGRHINVIQRDAMQAGRRKSDMPRVRGMRELALLALSLIVVACLGYLLPLPALPPKGVETSEEPFNSSDQRQRRKSDEHVQPTFQAQAEGANLTELPSRRLLLSTHNRLLWHFVDTNETVTLHQGQGVYYAAFPNEDVDNGEELQSLWVVSRPHNWHPKTTEEWLIRLDAVTGQELHRRQLASRFTHDVVRRRNRVYVCNTEAGEILTYAFPSLALLRRHSLFSRKQHVNTLVPLEPRQMLAVLHNLGQSSVAAVDLVAGKVTRTLSNAGVKSHGLVPWGSGFVMLSSEEGRLILLDERSGDVQTLWQCPRAGVFLKGLAVLDGVAYFGVCKFEERGKRQEEGSDCELAAVDLKRRALLWMRQVPTHGLLNTVSAPHLRVGSTYSPCASDRRNRTAAPPPGMLAVGPKAPRAAAQPPWQIAEDRIDSFRLMVEHEDRLDLGLLAPDAAHAVPTPGGGWWSSGLPRLQLKAKQRASDSAGIQLILQRVDVSDVRAQLASLPNALWGEAAQRERNVAWTGRKGFMERFKPGVHALFLLFSDGLTESAVTVYQMPLFELFWPQLKPLLLQVLGEEDLNKIVRMQFAKLDPGVQIWPHKDSGGWAATTHRIHIPITSDPGVVFMACLDKAPPCRRLQLEPGLVFEVNNRLRHFVSHTGGAPRVHLVVDVGESPHVRRRLRAGSECGYKSQRIVCPSSAFM